MLFQQQIKVHCGFI